MNKNAGFASILLVDSRTGYNIILDENKQLDLNGFVNSWVLLNKKQEMFENHFHGAIWNFSITMQVESLTLPTWWNTDYHIVKPEANCMWTSIMSMKDSLTDVHIDSPSFSTIDFIVHGYKLFI